MGHIRKMLAMKKLPSRVITPNQIWTDLCEDVHLHYRNVRLDYSEKEFAVFRAAIHQLGMAVEHVANENDYREGDPNFLIQQIFNERLDADSDYYPNRCTIELQKDGTVHFHYRDLRLHFSDVEFETIAKMFKKALAVMPVENEFPYHDVKERTRVTVPITLVQPYDEGHKPMVFDKEHRDGIEYCKKLISDGKKIRPILVDTKGQRLDGFKRYFAQLEFGKADIECFVDPYGKMGGQHGQGMVDDESWADFCSDCGAPHWPENADASVISWECKQCKTWNDTEKLKEAL
jgi:hypothetical protein